jgi:hypothetical protein
LFKNRDFCDVKGWEQPIITSLGDDGVPPPKKTEANANSSITATAEPETTVNAEVSTVAPTANPIAEETTTVA